MTWETLALGLFIAAGAGVLVPVAAWMKHREYLRRLASLPAARELEDLHAQIPLLQEKVQDLYQQEARRNQAVAETDEAVARKRQIDEDLRHLEPKRLELEEIERRLADEHQTLADLLQSKLNAEQQIVQSRQILQDHQARLAALQEKAEQAQAIADQLPKLQAELQTLQSQLAAKQQEIAHAEARLAEAQKDLAQGEGRRDSLHAEVRGLEQRRGELERLLANLDAQFQQAVTLRDKAETDSLADLTRPPPCLADAGLTQSRGSVTEDQALRNLHDYLENLGLHFHQRTLYAFHTCLKINDLSPLTVLAGISGTGKSELPRRYAEGMGMHFLQMAVQPRWDSPQDLFGFYNYLEHRYIATDLARALVHLDRHNHPNLAAAWQDHILLVLLDEMNLARVEYYFSEFLSRLEVRKSVVADDPAKRLAAEIQLDIGGRNEPFNLFVDRNVLFVGTMNEDESTQTLSDKVIDRANVLRFGRPSQLAATQPGQGTQAGGRYLPRDTWVGWARRVDHLAAADRQRLSSWINDLNQAMEGLDRPFAHRINQAMLLYCANYPDQGAQGLRSAFADQLEQRILPKLRGVDTAEFSAPLGQVQALIAEVGDPELNNAFDAGRQRPLFAWQGVNRQ